MHVSQREVSSKEIFLVAIVASSYFLHLLRNISEIYAVIPVVVSVIGGGLLLRRRSKVDLLGVCVLISFICLYFAPVIYSFIWYPGERYMVSFARYFYIFPFIFFCVIAISNLLTFVYLLKVFAVFVVIGGLSIFYQIVFGPIHWFPDASEREGLVRFSSLVGSLTAYGIISVFALPIVLYLFKDKMIRNCSIAVIVMAMLCTLQKAAIANIVLFSILLFVSGSLLYKLKIILSLFFVAPLLLVLFYCFDVGYVVATVDNVLKLKEGSGDTDVPFFQSILDRLWYLPSQLYEMHGSSGMTYGVGMVGGSGTLGFPEYPMAHNGYFDLLFIGGFLNLFIFLLMALLVIYRLCWVKKYCMPGSLSGCAVKASLHIYILFLVNMIFSGPLHMQPYGGVVFYGITVFVCLRWNEIRKQAFSCKVLVDKY